MIPWYSVDVDTSSASASSTVKALMFRGSVVPLRAPDRRIGTACHDFPSDSTRCPTGLCSILAITRMSHWTPGGWTWAAVWTTRSR